VTWGAMASALIPAGYFEVDDETLLTVVALGALGYAFLFQESTKHFSEIPTAAAKVVIEEGPKVSGGAAAVIAYPIAKVISEITNTPIAQESATYAADYPGYQAANPWDTFRLGWNISPLGGAWALR